MKIITWNVNSVRVRLEHLIEMLQTHMPDIVCLQEIKVVNELFPYDELKSVGYNSVVHGQKGFNGVALLSKAPALEIKKGLDGMDGDNQARWIEAGWHIKSINKILKVCCLYLPNGNPCNSSKYDYKKEWMEKLHAYSMSMIDSGEMVIMTGDFNVIPRYMDVWSVDSVKNNAVFTEEVRALYHRIVHYGWVDAQRVLYPQEEHFSFWDYTSRAWQNNHGMSIDHILLSPPAADYLVDSGIELKIRDKTQPSDHAPVWCELSITCEESE